MSVLLTVGLSGDAVGGDGGGSDMMFRIMMGRI